MASGTAAGVLVLPRGTTLPVPPPPGLTVVAASGAAGTEPTGAAIADLLGATRCATVDQAAALLARRKDEATAGAAEHLRVCAVAATAARAAAERAQLGLCTVPPGLASATVRSALHTVAEAVEAVREAREAVGSRPGYDDTAAGSARAAQAEVDRARRDRGEALPRANRVLAMANAAAVLVVAGRMASEAFDRAFVLVALLPVGALGYAAYAVVAPARRGRAAARRRWSALRSMNVSTLGGMAALEERAGAWERRAARLTAAEAELRSARQAWRSLVGDGVALASAERLAADLDSSAARHQDAAAAAAAWAAAALALQAAEDSAPAGEPLVVLDSAAGGEFVVPGTAGAGGFVVPGTTGGDARFVPGTGPGADRYVVPDTDPGGGGADHSAAAQRLAALAGATTVVLVVAEPAPAPPAAVDEDAVVESPAPSPARPALVPRPPADVTAAAPSTGDVIVDLRERVKAGLLRLRARSASPRDPSAPGSATG